MRIEQWFSCSACQCLFGWLPSLLSSSFFEDSDSSYNTPRMLNGVLNKSNRFESATLFLTIFGKHSTSCFVRT